MTDYTIINDSIVSDFVGLMQGAPGLFRANQVDGHRASVSYVGTIYTKLGLDKIQKAAAYNNLAYQMRRCGYGWESYEFAEISNKLDPSNTTQVIANMSFMAYAMGMINGHYRPGLALYGKVDTYMREKGAFNDVALIKSYQNAGQLEHRLGMSDGPVNYKWAERDYQRALEALNASKNLNEAQKAQYRGQIGYCYAKTLTHMARVEPDNAPTLLNMAMMQIEAGIESIAETKNFDFERACFMAVKGDVHAARGDKETAEQVLQAALVDQKRFGPTLGSRIAATSFKLDRVRGVEPLGAIVLAQRFFGPKGHPDLTYYRRAVAGSSLGPSLKGPGL